MIISHVSKSFGGRRVLVDVSCEVNPGGVLRVAGPNGCGKSTLLKIVLGLVKPDSGRVDGVPAQLSAVFQEDRLCPGMSAVSNLALVVPGLTREAAAAALERIGLGASAMSQPVRELSGGQRRRVAIARALAAPAGLVCLDEPFTGIDADSLPGVAAALVSGTAGKIVLLVTHDDEQAALFQPAVLTLPVFS